MKKINNKETEDIIQLFEIVDNYMFTEQEFIEYNEIGIKEEKTRDEAKEKRMDLLALLELAEIYL